LLPRARLLLLLLLMLLLLLLPSLAGAVPSLDARPPAAL
jgi:hypothetical protein